MAKLTRVRQPLHFLATTVEGSLYLLRILFCYEEYGETGSLPVYVVGVLPLCQQHAVGEGAAGSSTAGGTKLLWHKGLGERSDLPVGEEKGLLAAGSRRVSR